MDVWETLTELKKKAKEDPELLEAVLATEKKKNALSEFCRISTMAGLQLYEMDILDAGEAAYAAMKRSTNGGGENSPLLQFEDDTFELFLAELRAL